MSFAALSAAMDAAHLTRLADDIGYIPAGGALLAIRGYADIGERIEDLGQSAARTTDAAAEIPVAEFTRVGIVRPPIKADRFVLPDGETYYPLSWPLSDDGRSYVVTFAKAG